MPKLEHHNQLLLQANKWYQKISCMLEYLMMLMILYSDDELMMLCNGADVVLCKVQQSTIEHDKDGGLACGLIYQLKN